MEEHEADAVVAYPQVHHATVAAARGGAGGRATPAASTSGPARRTCWRARRRRARSCGASPPSGRRRGAGRGRAAQPSGGLRSRSSASQARLTGTGTPSRSPSATTAPDERLALQAAAGLEVEEGGRAARRRQAPAGVGDVGLGGVGGHGIPAARATATVSRPRASISPPPAARRTRLPTRARPSAVTVLSETLATSFVHEGQVGVLAPHRARRSPRRRLERVAGRAVAAARQQVAQLAGRRVAAGAPDHVVRRRAAGSRGTPRRPPPRAPGHSRRMAAGFVDAVLEGEDDGAAGEGRGERPGRAPRCRSS